MKVGLLTLMCVFETFLLSSSPSEESPALSSEQRNSTDTQQAIQCSESWCNESYGDSYPPGLLFKDRYCKCPKQYPHMMLCDSEGLSIHVGYCATLDETNDTIVIGRCIYTDIPLWYNNESKTVYDRISTMELCHNYSRTGALCGRCLPDHYPLAYSYNMTCIPCPHAHWNWFRYIMAAYLPLTVFYLAILFFKINTTTSHLFVVVYICQLELLPALAQMQFIIVEKLGNEHYMNTMKVFASTYMIWNLDFFRPFYSDLCLGIGILPTLTLDYAIAVYPLLLMIITYLLITLHNKNRVIVFLLRPVRFTLFLLRRSWDIKTSLIDAFSTFFLLSNIKFLSVSFSLLTPVMVYSLRGDHYNTSFGLYYAGDIEYFGSEHLPYAILAIAVLCVSVILPITVLALYPFNFFQKFLKIFPVRWYILIVTFMDSFQGCYKDGTEPGTRDCRVFSSVFFILRISMFLVYSTAEFYISVVILTMILVIQTALLVTVQPYKKTLAHLNTANIISLQVITLFTLCVSGGYISKIVMPSLTYYFYVLMHIIGAVPQLCIIVIMLRWIYTHRLFGLTTLQRLRAWRNGYNILNDKDQHLPDRIENSGAYPRENLANFVSNSRPAAVASTTYSTIATWQYSHGDLENSVSTNNPP